MVDFFRVRRWKPQKEKHCNLFCAACGGHNEWRAPNRILVVQLGVNANEANVLKAHGAPLELCDNLINELKMLANQLKDGGLHERSRRGIMKKLRSFMKEKNHCAVDVGHLRKGMRPFKVQKPNFRRITQRPPSLKEQMS